MKAALLAAAVLAAAPAFADFNDKKPITATVTGATPSGYPRTMVEGLNAVVRDTYPGSAISFKPNSPGGGVLAVADKQADFTATATGTEIRLANEGKDPYKTPLKGKFSYVMQLYDNQFMHFVMTKEWADANGIKSWADIAAKKPKMRLAINRKPTLRARRDLHWWLRDRGIRPGPVYTLIQVALVIAAVTLAVLLFSLFS